MRTCKEVEGVEFTVPESIKKEHEELHEELAEATRAGGKVGDAAKLVARLFRPHAEKEEEYALPPLGLLSQIAGGKAGPEMADIFKMTDKLKAELQTMLQEHISIVVALKNLSDIAKKEKRTEYADFGVRLTAHARMEEEVMYPASLLVGEYLKLRLGK
jgi:rubrerythrin